MPEIHFVEQLTDDPVELDERLRKPVSKWEFTGLALALVFPLAVMLISGVEFGEVLGVDFGNFIKGARGDFSFYYYAYWLLPLWSLFNLLPLKLAYLLWTSLSTITIFYAARMFGARSVLLLLSYQMMLVLFMDQFAGMILAGLAILWWGLTHKRWYIAGIGLIMVASKYHTGLVPALALLICLDIRWKDRLKVLVIPTIVAVASLIIYPLWPLNVVETFRTNPPNDWGSITL